MKECKTSLTRIATNLTREEFRGYCKGMSLHWLFKILDEPKANVTTHKRVNFWDSAYDKYKANCKNSEWN